MGDDDALRSGVQQPKNQIFIIPGHSNDGGDASQVGGGDHLANQAQVKGRMLHIDESGIEAGQADNLDYLRVGEGNVGSQGQLALLHDVFHPVLAHHHAP